MSHIDLSAIICTRDRPQLLADCLDTLERQELGEKSIEVIVVDDGSKEPLEPLVEGRGSDRIHFRYVRQQPGGLNVARNTGAREARAELIAWLDDDVYVDPGWARELIGAFDSPSAGIAGRIELHYEVPKPRWLWMDHHGYLSAFYAGPEPSWLTDGQWPYGANCAVKREWFDRVGGFAKGLDREGASLISSGDVEFFQRVKDAGGKLLYWPAAVVHHRVPAERLTLAYFRRRGFAQGISDAAVEGPPATWVEANRWILDLAWRFARIGLVVGKNLRLRRGQFSAHSQLAYVRGRLSAGRGWWREGRFPASRRG